MKTPATLIFDLDGTLIDSAPDLHFAANAALTALDRAALELASVTSFIGNGVETLMERCLTATGGCDSKLHARALDIFLSTYDQHNATLTRCYPGVLACLDRLKEQGVQLGLCTNKPQTPADEICKKLKLDGYFTTIHGARPSVPKKPDPAPLFNCIREMGGDPAQTQYVGDSEVDQKTAQNAGIDFVFFTGGYLNQPLAGPAPFARFSDWSRQWRSDA